MASDNDIQRFKQLFKANTHTYYVYKDGKHSHASNKVLNTFQYKDHLNKEYSLVLVPTTDDGLSYFGVIDLDNHGGDIDLITLDKKINKLKLPLVVCRSKSGSGHVYLFLSEPVPTSDIRETLFSIAERIRGVGEEAIEIFPKQDKVDFVNTNNKGSGIQIPYALDTTYALSNGRRLSLTEFIDKAFTLRVNKKTLLKIKTDDDSEAPPCIQVLLRRITGEGQRNNTLFNYGIYVKRAYPSDWKTKIQDFNNNNFKTPLLYEEVENIVKQINKTDYRYKCQEEPLKGLCDSHTCVKRKYGIDDEEKKELELADLPEFTALKKYLTEPVKWSLIYENVTVTLTTEELLDFKHVRKKIFENSNKLVANMKSNKWQLILDNLTKDVIEVETPDDAGKSGVVRKYFDQYIKNSIDVRYDQNKINNRGALLENGKPIIDHIKKISYFLFSGTHFQKFLEGKKCNTNTTDIWMALIPKGIVTKKINISKKGKHSTVRCWAVGIGPIEETKRIETVEDIEDVIETVDFEDDY